MKKILAFLLFPISIITLSCETELNVKLIPQNPLLVLNCAVVSDSTWLLSLSRTGNILDYSPANFPVNNAVITIRDEKNQVIEKLENFSPAAAKPGTPSPSQNYNYRGKTSPVPGKTYSIVATYGDEIIQASTRIPAPVSLTSVEIDSSRFKSERDVEMK